MANEKNLEILYGDGNPKPITELYCYVTSVENGEVTAGFYDRTTGTWFSMIGADIERMNSLEIPAQAIANNTGRTLKLIRFATREEIKEIKPTSSEEEASHEIEIYSLSRK